MKNQYLGDIGDYGKYGLLRFLAKEGKVKIGVNWYLTEDDEPRTTDDGKKKGDGGLRPQRGEGEAKGDEIYDEALLSILEKVPDVKERDISFVRENNIIPDAIYFEDKLDTVNELPPDPDQRRENRRSWHEKAMSQLRDGTELIFADPDNGVTKCKKLTNKNGEKYISYCEIKDYYMDGKNVVFYCHRGRRSVPEWKAAVDKLREKTDAKFIVLTFHRGTQRSYVFCVHPENYDKYRGWISEFEKTKWCTEKVGNKKIPFEVEKV